MDGIRDHLEPETFGVFFVNGDIMMYEVWCPYCGQRARCGHQSEIHKSRPSGRIYICDDCQAYVGCHAGSRRPLGTLANKELRAWRRITHLVFDPYWKSGCIARTQAYAWLAYRLGLDYKRCHIGAFDLTLCQKAVAICWPIVEGCYED